MNITKVTLSKVENMGRKKAVASILIDDCFCVNGIEVIEGTNCYFISMPSKKNKSGEYKDIAHPINSDTREKIQKAILDKFFEEKN